MDELYFRVEVQRFSCRAGLLMTANVCTQSTGNSSHWTQQLRALGRSCSMDALQHPLLLVYYSAYCRALLSAQTVCLSITP